MTIEEINIKFAILGAGKVGKTSIINAFINNDFSNTYIPTIGGNAVRKEYILDKFVVRLNIWDIGGQRSFNPLNPGYFTDLDAAFLVFEVSNTKNTLLELQEIYLKKINEFSPESLTFLIGNKGDLITSEDDLNEIVDHFSIKEIPLIFMSSKTNENVNEAFELLIYDFLQKREKLINSQEKIHYSKLFLEFLGKNKDQLNNLFVNLKNINFSMFKKKKFTAISKKIISSTSDIDVGSEQVDLFRGLKFKNFKNEIVNAYKNNLIPIENLISNLKKTPIESLLTAIDKTIKEINYLKDDFELKLNTLLDFEINKIIK